MALKNPEAEKYANELVKAGLLSNADKNRMEFDEGYSNARYSLKDIRGRVDERRLKSSDWQAFERISEDAGMEKPVRITSDVQRIQQATTPSISGWIHQAISAPGAAVGWAYAQLDKFDGEDYLEEGGQTRRDIQRALEDVGINVPIDALTRPNSLEELIETLSDDFDVAPEALDKVITEANDAAIQRAVDEKRTEDRLEENEAIDRTNETNPTFATNLAAFQILDSAHPTKYKFDQASGAIYLTETGFQVDRRGNELAHEDLEGGAALVGGWPDGVAPVFQPDPLGTGWGKMSADTGVAVDEAGYMDVLDVINNKEWYGADPSRYLSGEAFLGGFDDAYRVKVEENDVSRRMRATVESFGGQSATRSMLGDAVWGAMDDSLQEWRRPWYENNDQWSQFVGLSPENIAAVQKTMVEMGALDPNDIVWGSWLTTEGTQMKKILTIANREGLEWTSLDMEDMQAEFATMEAGSTPQRAAFVPDPYRPMDPATVELTVRDSVRALIGRDPTEEDLQQLGGYLTDQYSSSYQADVAAGKAQYNAQVAADDANASFGQPGAVDDVDFESRYILEMEKRFQPQIESQERGELAGRQQDMGQSMSNLMNKLGGGLG